MEYEFCISDYTRFINDKKNRESIDHLINLSETGKACQDCSTIDETVLSLQTIGGKTIAQCSDCRSIDAFLDEKRVDICQAAEMFAARRLANYKKFILQ